MILQGKYKTAEIYAKEIAPNLIEQTKTLLDQPFSKGSNVKIMPDCHVGKGSVIGFTAHIGDTIVPNIVGVDIGCGLLTVELGNVEIDFKRLDDFIRKNIPLGFKVQPSIVKDFPQLEELTCYNQLKDITRLRKSIGSLGGGNHFIEICKDDDNTKYLLIHSGSRNLGTQVAEYHQAKAIRKNSEDVPRDLKYLEGQDVKDYLQDMEISQEFASVNRLTIAEIILEKFFNLTLSKLTHFETVHNYVSFKDNIIRKGAVSAHKEEMLTIPLNMRDGALICRGKGNPDWNCSAPHGAGRLYSRNEAKKILDVEEFKSHMKGIYSSSISKKTLDEAPAAYKPMEDIMDIISPTVEIVKLITPIYNIKG